MGFSENEKTIVKIDAPFPQIISFMVHDGDVFAGGQCYYEFCLRGFEHKVTLPERIDPWVLALGAVLSRWCIVFFERALTAGYLRS